MGDEPEGIVYLFLFWYPAPVQAPSILSHLMSPDFVGLDGASLEDLLQAQAETTSSLIGHSRAGADGSSGSLIDFNAHSETLTGLEAQAVRSAFAAVTSPEAPIRDQKAAVLALRVPPAVKHLAGMLSQYDWAFVEQAKEIRGYVVAQLLEETKNPDAKVRLKALELTGKLTEVGSFMERVTVTKVDASAEELTSRIRDRLAKLLPPQQPVADVIDVAEPAAFAAPAP